ncbi:MAG: hypothetical protein JSW51_14060 [Gemmatimonadota bacterium]|nr:MAG: hypothetical protein JSW51_14060 [Gemmatimonadota bacterium]
MRRAGYGEQGTEYRTDNQADEGIQTMKKVLVAITVALVASLLTVPARAQDVEIAGKWETTRETPNGTMTSTFTFDVDGNKLTGTIESPRWETEISDGTVDGNEISFKIVMSRGDRTFEMSYSGTVEGDTITGTMTTPRGDMPWTATRVKD